MKTITRYIRQYFYETDKRVLGAVTVFTALLVFLNYYYKLDDWITQRPGFLFRFFTRFILFLLAFVVPYLIYIELLNRKYLREFRFRSLLLLAPALFALKIALGLRFHLSEDPDWNLYWQFIIYWPLLVIIIGSLLFVIWKRLDRDQPFYGLTTRNLDWKPYFLMLLIMLPLVIAASTQPDFLSVYPKLKLISGVYDEPALRWWHKLLFELSYGSDFITIELFFRGFAVLAFIKWAGKDAILPMACFYCTIHFGKPLGECISSYAGGILLGIVVYHTRSILGGLMVHLGIAWMMEAGGYFGNNILRHL